MGTPGREAGPRGKVMPRYKRYKFLSRSRKDWPCAACGAVIRQGFCLYEADYGTGARATRTCLACAGLNHVDPLRLAVLAQMTPRDLERALAEV